MNGLRYMMILENCTKVKVVPVSNIKYRVTRRATLESRWQYRNRYITLDATSRYYMRYNVTFGQCKSKGRAKVSLKQTCERYRSSDKTNVTFLQRQSDLQKKSRIITTEYDKNTTFRWYLWEVENPTRNNQRDDTQQKPREHSSTVK